MVLPADIGRVGGDGAVILALMRYATEFDDGRHGRQTIDGRVWWRTSHKAIGDALGGIDRETVRRHVSKLEIAGELVVFDPKDSADRTRLSTVPAQSLCDSEAPPTSHYADLRQAASESTHPASESTHPASNSTHALLFREVREVENLESGGADAPAPATVEPSVVGNPQTANAVTLFEADSPTPVPAKRTARKKKPHTEFPEGWRPTEEQMAELRAKYPALDIDWEFEAFEARERMTGRTYADWWMAFCKRLLGGGDYNKPTNGHQYANNDDKILNGWAVVGTNNTRKAIS